MTQNERHAYDGSRWVLYHGTTTYRLKSILKDGRLSRQGIGEQKISLTTERSVADYFSNVALHGDKHDHPDEESTAVTLVIDGEKLLALGYKLVPFSDTYHGPGKCDWENEIACWDRDIEHLDEVLMAVEPVPPERFQVFLKRGRVAFKPAIPPMGHFELSIMKGTFKRLAKGKITPADADGVVSALAALRSALQPGRGRSMSSAT
jgi:hypothetical protein